MLLLFMIMGVILFASGVYFCENQENKEQFPSIPHSFWWAIVTMTTVGYGDVTPKTFPGEPCNSVLVKGRVYFWISLQFRVK